MELQESPKRFWPYFAAMAVATVGAFSVAGEAFVVVLVPLVGVVAFWALNNLRLRTSLVFLMFAVLVADYIAERPHDGFWESPLHPLGRLLFVNLNHLTPIAFLRFPPLDFLILFLGGIAVYRKAHRSKVDPPPVSPTARILNHALVLSFLTILVFEVWGVARGGNFKESLWQFHQLGFVPILTFLFMSALSGRRVDATLLAKVIVIAACIKSLIAAYFIHAIARPQGLVPEFATSHSDSFLFVTAIMIGIVWWFERPSWASFGRVMCFLPLVFWGLMLNERRLAYVSLGGSLIALFLFVPWTKTKLRIVRMAVAGLPLILAYLVVGWGSSASVFIPVQTFKSVLVGEQTQLAQPDYRDLENFNLLMTWWKNPVLGSGFGHKFEEPVKMPDISAAMPNYQYQPHNTILWLWGVLGYFGFSGLFLYLVVVNYLAARSYRLASSSIDRMVCLVTISIVLQYLVQCYGDMGTISWIGAFFVAPAIALVSRIAIRVGAWSSPNPSIGA